MNPGLVCTIYPPTPHARASLTTGALIMTPGRGRHPYPYPQIHVHVTVQRDQPRDALAGAGAGHGPFANTRVLHRMLAIRSTIAHRSWLVCRPYETNHLYAPTVPPKDRHAHVYYNLTQSMHSLHLRCIVRTVITTLLERTYTCTPGSIPITW